MEENYKYLIDELIEDYNIPYELAEFYYKILIQAYYDVDPRVNFRTFFDIMVEILFELYC